MSANLRKQQAGFTLIGLIIAVAIIIVLFVCNDNAFFSRENDIAKNKAIYEEAEKDLEEGRFHKWEDVKKELGINVWTSSFR